MTSVYRFSFPPRRPRRPLLATVGGSSGATYPITVSTTQSQTLALAIYHGVLYTRVVSATQSQTLVITPSPVGGVLRRTGAEQTVTGATRVNTTVPKPTTVAILNGDCMLMQLYIETAVTVTPPTGWTELIGSPIVGGANLIRWYYKFALSEPASWTWTHASAFTGVNFATYIGVDRSVPIFPLDHITTTKTVVNNTNNEILAGLFTINRTGSFLIGGASTANGRALSDHHGMFTVACWTPPNGVELDEQFGPWDGIAHSEPTVAWAAGDSAGATTGERRFTFSGTDYLTTAIFALQPGPATTTYNLTVAATQPQVLALSKAIGLGRVLTQAQTLSVAAQKVFLLTVSATQGQAVSLTRSATRQFLLTVSALQAQLASLSTLAHRQYRLTLSLNQSQVLSISATVPVQPPPLVGTAVSSGAPLPGIAVRGP